MYSYCILYRLQVYNSDSWPLKGYTAFIIIVKCIPLVDNVSL